MQRGCQRGSANIIFASRQEFDISCGNKITFHCSCNLFQGAGMVSSEQERVGRWDYALDVGLTLWILRGPLAAVAIGALILLKVPQSQDLLVETATDPGSIFSLLLLLMLVWALPTHYAARVLLATDERFARRIDDGHKIFLHWLQ